MRDSDIIVDLSNLLMTWKPSCLSPFCVTYGFWVQNRVWSRSVFKIGVRKSRQALVVEVYRIRSSIVVFSWRITCNEGLVID